MENKKSSLRHNMNEPYILPGVYCIDHAAQWVIKKCRLPWLTNSALVYEPKCGGRGGSCGVSAN
jgi:hypothetical protein